MRVVARLFPPERGLVSGHQQALEDELLRTAVPLYAAHIPLDANVDQLFPEGMGLVRPMTQEEVDQVHVELADRSEVVAMTDAFVGLDAGHQLVVTAGLHEEQLRAAGVLLHRVPFSWVDSYGLSEGYDDREVDDGVGEDLGLSAEALTVNPPSVNPVPTCTATPAADAFCPYATAASVSRGSNCNISLRQQMVNGQTTFGPVLIGGISRAYYQRVDLGMTTGLTTGGLPSARMVTGVRVGRQPGGGGPAVVREIVVVGGQHANEWEAIEMVRRLMFDFAARYQSGDAAVRAALDEQAILFIPVLNPDGYDHTHTATANRTYRFNMQACSVSGGQGIDINRSFSFSWALDSFGSSPGCATTAGAGSPRGDFALQATEANLLRSALAVAGYRPTLLIDVHQRLGTATVPEGFSLGALTSTSTCTDRSNCQSPDSGAFYRAFGTERAPLLRWPSATTVPYLTDQTHRAIYPANGTLPGEGMYGTLPMTGGQPTPNMLSGLIELAAPCGLTSMEHRTSATTLTQQATDLRNMLLSQLSQLPALAAGTATPLELPLVMRRNVPPHAAAEALTMRVAIRNGLTGVTITNAAGVAGTTSADDVRAGALYSLHRWRPSGNGWVFPGLSAVCATGINCGTVAIDGGPSTVHLCSASRFIPGSAWTFTGDQAGTPEECFWTLTQPGVAASAASNLTSTPRDLTRMRESRLVVSFRRDWLVETFVGGSGLYFDVEVSSNSFSGCSFTNYGNCRIVRRVGDGEPRGVRYSPSRLMRTVVADVSDFDARPQVQVRIRVWSNADSTCGNGVCDTGEAGALGSCVADCPGGADNPRLRIYDPVFVGWYQ